ncbi:MAG: phospho-N-acetylmuramoyl-pentapeptide-transferase [Candidatus Melainabacteria bacterium]|nr:phospho-N-acetylmuramoyl-pentapeptide-transferase [Candidatus Melainabacteria bacterium]
MNNCHYLILILISVASSLLLGKSLIKLLKSLNAKQAIRQEGPLHHVQNKSRTPTIGGLIFLISVLFIILISIILNKKLLSFDLIIVLSITFIMAILGFIDDYLKVIKKHNKGISGWIKLFIQFLVSIVFFSTYYEGASLVYLFWVFFIISGSSNSYNLTDGLDGLVTSISLLSFLGFFVLFLTQGKTELAIFCVIFFGSLLGFLYFNKYPAKVFMGDTGSLAIGGAIGSLAIASRVELLLIFFATIPILEALSVILQVASCQLSKRFLGVDQRIFKMTPLHHHFELSGWKETDIVKSFFVFQLICVIIGISIQLWHKNLSAVIKW